MHTTVCPKCSRSMPLDTLDEVSGFAVCRCGGLFEVDGISIYDGHPRMRSRIPAPASFSMRSSALEERTGAHSNAPEAGYRAAVEKPGPELAMSWPLDDVRMGRWTLLFVCATFWYGCFIFGGLALDGRDRAHAESQMPKGRGTAPAVYLIATATLAVPALACTYLLLASLKNRSNLRVSNALLSVRHGPVPLHRGTSVAIADIDQIFCSRERTGRHGAFISYSIHARLRTGDVSSLVTHLSRPVSAMFIQQTVEDVLELPHRAGVTNRDMIDDLDRTQRTKR